MENNLTEQAEPIADNNMIEQKFSKFIIVVSILIPVVVAILFSVKLKDFGIQVEPFSFFFL